MRRLTLAAAIAVAGAALADEPARPAEAPAPAGSQEARATAGTRQAFDTIDRLELETTSITGNQELPKVMVVVPWKKAELGDLPGKPARSLIDEILAPVDRDVFRREVGFFDALDGPPGPRAAQAETPVTPESPAP